MDLSDKTIALMQEMWAPEEWAGRVGALIEEAHRRWWYQQRSLRPKETAKPAGRPRRSPIAHVQAQLISRLFEQVGNDEAMEPMRHQLAARIEQEDWEWVHRFEAAAPWQMRWKWAGKEWDESDS